MKHDKDTIGSLCLLQGPGLKPVTSYAILHTSKRPAAMHLAGHVRPSAPGGRGHRASSLLKTAPNTVSVLECVPFRAAQHDSSGVVPKSLCLAAEGWLRLPLFNASAQQI
jgi:hypothetical protein